MKYFFILSFLISIASTSYAQSEKKLQKLLNKGKYDKVMSQGMRSHQRNTSKAYPFKYMSWACWFKAQSFQQFSATQWKYVKRSVENYNRYEKLLSNDEKRLSTLENKITFYLNELIKEAQNNENTSLIADVKEISEFGFSLKNLELSTNENINIKPSESFSPFSFTYQEGNYETFFKAENINIPPNLIAKKADDYIGVPYKYAKVNPYDGFDCSGFVLYIYQQFGVDFPHNTKRIAMLGKTINLKDVQEGDIVCFGSNNSDDFKAISHIGMIYKIGEDTIEMIHCGSSTGVIVAPLTNGYWESRPYFIKRLLTLDQERLIK